MTARTLTISLLAGALAACASVPQPQVHRTQRSADAEDAKAGSGDIRKEILQELGSDGPQPVIRRGNGGVINQKVASAPPPSLASSGQASFNFEGESLQAVVKAILGDMLGQSYSIAPVSYTHLDVYKRQGHFQRAPAAVRYGGRRGLSAHPAQ